MPNWPRVCFQMIVWNAAYVLPEVIEAVRPYGPLVITEGPVGYWRRMGYTASTDGTREILDLSGLPYLSGAWAEKDDMVNAGLERIPADTEFVWVVDSDEVWRPQDIERILNTLATGDIDSMAFHAHSFYGGFTRVMGGFEESFEVHRIQRWYPGARWQTHRPPTVLAPDGRPWREHRHLGGERNDAAGLRFWHYSYVWPRQMRDKARYYDALDGGNGGTIPNYFERVYKPWVAAYRARDFDALHAIELAYDGVHNWIPERRGPAWTRPANIGHPASIDAAMPRLMAQFESEWEAVANADNRTDLR